MKRFSLPTFFALIIAAVLPGCKKYLDVQPEDRLLEGKTFSSVSSINTVLNGLYLDLTHPGIYGDNYTLSTLEIMAQRYNVGSTHIYNRIGAYAYTDASTTARMESAWTRSYALILNINAFLENLEKYKGTLSPDLDSIYRGEAIGMRAMLHFDLLRLFGPMYNSADSIKQSIPAYKQSLNEIQPLLPANSVMDSITTDPQQAERLLINDPIRISGVQKTILNDGKDFMRRRNYRFNYFAVKALKARVNMYRGNKPEALAAATEVIASPWFPWVNPSNVLNNLSSPDRVFTSEMIMGVQFSMLYDSYNTYFAPERNETSILAPLSSRLQTLYETNEADYRYNLNWKVPGDGGKTYRTFYKYADIVVKDSSYRFTIPLIKKSEMYYIAAVCSSDLTTAFSYLNAVRNNRGLASLSVTTSATLTAELQKEYQKEFFGEGQLFYYYKRRNITSIPNGAATTGNVTMNANTYVVPLPLSETQYRQ